jgi:hypothetical protein
MKPVRLGAMNIAQVPGMQMSVSAISLEDSRQPDQLPSREIQAIMRGLEHDITHAHP